MKFGSLDITDCKLGTTPIVEVRRGTELIWPNLIDDTTGLPYGTEYNSSEISNKYIGTPSIIKLSSGRLIASNDYPGDWGFYDTSAVFYSDNGGTTWTLAQEITGMWWAKLFTYNGNVYLLGCTERFGAVAICESTDNGLTWSAPLTVLASEQSGWHTSATEVIIKDGYVVSAFEIRNSNVGSIAGWYESTLILGDVNDLMNAASWSRLNSVAFDALQYDTLIGTAADNTKYPPATGAPASRGFLEGNITDDGSTMEILLRAEITPNSNYAVSLPVTWDSVTPTNSTIGTAHSYFDFPGGDKKFSMVYDTTSGKWWSVTTFNRYKHLSDARIESYLISSTGRQGPWQVHSKVVGYSATTDWENELLQLGAQYSDIVIDGNNLLVVTRLADANANNWHNANKGVFTTIENFRDIPVTSKDGGLLIDENSEILEDANGVAVIHDQTSKGNSAFMLSVDNTLKPSWNAVNQCLQFRGAHYMRLKHDKHLALDNGVTFFIVVKNIQSVTGQRILSNTDGVDVEPASGKGGWWVAANTGLAIEEFRGNYSDVTAGGNYIIAGAFDAVNNHIYNYLNGANRGQPASLTNTTWDTDHLVMSGAYSGTNLNEIRMGDREVGTSLPLDADVYTIKVDGFMSEAEIIAEMNSLNTKYSIY